MSNNVINLSSNYKVIPCECGCYHFFIKESLIAVCQECDHEIITHNSLYELTENSKDE